MKSVNEVAAQVKYVKPTTRCPRCGTRNLVTLIRCGGCLKLNDGKR